MSHDTREPLVQSFFNVINGQLRLFLFRLFLYTWFRAQIQVEDEQKRSEKRITVAFQHTK